MFYVSATLYALLGLTAVGLMMASIKCFKVARRILREGKACNVWTGREVDDRDARWYGWAGYLTSGYFALVAAAVVWLLLRAS